MPTSPAYSGIDVVVGALTTAVLLALLVTLPVLQFVALGYLLNAAGRLAQTGKLRDAFPGLREASRIGQSLFGAWVWSLPWRLFESIHRDAGLVGAGPLALTVWRRLADGALALALTVVVLAILRGGRLIDFFRPLRALRSLWTDVRAGDWPRRTFERARTFVSGFALGRCFSLGVRGYLGAAAWLVAPTTLMALGGKGPIMLIGAALLVFVLLHLPFLQIHFAAHGELSRLLEWRAARDLYARAPLAFFVALAVTLSFALPLYLLKIELVPREALWLPAAVFLITIFPTKLVAAWAYHRAARRKDPAHPLWRWLGRGLMIPIAALYALIVFLTRFTGWHGVWGLYEHHAFLLPVPF